MRIRLVSAILLILACSIAPQNLYGQAKPHQDKAEATPMNTGVLAILADQGGRLFVDGVEGGQVVPGKVLALKLLAGQHFVDLRDEAGRKTWEKVIDIPAGAQIAEKISQGQTQSAPSSQPPTPTSTPTPQSTTSSTQLYRSISSQILAGLLKDKGYTPEIRKLEAADLIVFPVEGSTTAVLFYQCASGDCGSFQYRASWKMEEKPTLDLINDFNWNKRNTTAALDKNHDPVLTMDVHLEGGVTSQYIIESLDRWRGGLILFRRALAAKKVE